MESERSSFHMHYNNSSNNKSAITTTITPDVLPHGPLHATTPGAVAAFHDPALPKSTLMSADMSSRSPSSSSTTAHHHLHHDTETMINMDEQVKQLEKWKRANEERLWKEAQQQQHAAAAASKVVQFADTALLYSSDRSYEEDVLPAWYTRDELAVLKQQRKEIVQTLKRFNFDLLAVERRYCLRGYEPYFSLQVNKAMKYARSLVQSLVFTEQERQWKHGLVEPEAIRESSCCASQWARDNALQLGKNDEMEVFGEYAAMLEEAEAAAAVQQEVGYNASTRQLQQQDQAALYLQSSQPPIYEQRKRKGSNITLEEQQGAKTQSSSSDSDNRKQSSLSVDEELESARRLYQQLRLPPR